MASVVGFPAVYQRVVAHWRGITLLLILALGTFLIAHAEFFLLFVIALPFTASQIFWIRRMIDLGERLLPGQPGRARVAVIVNLAYLFVIAYRKSRVRERDRAIHHRAIRLVGHLYPAPGTQDNSIGRRRAKSNRDRRTAGRK
jgi:hypothetical protein